MRACQKDCIAEGVAKLLSGDFRTLVPVGSELPVLFSSIQAGENLAAGSVILDTVFDEIHSVLIEQVATFPNG